MKSINRASETASRAAFHNGQAQTVIIINVSLMMKLTRSCFLLCTELRNYLNAVEALGCRELVHAPTVHS